MSARISIIIAVASMLSLACGPTSTADAGVGESVNGCAPADFAAHDLSSPSAARVITFPTGATPAQYSPPCITIGVGQMVTWNGAFSSHPLVQFGGDPTMWIQPTSTGTSISFGFPVGGTYGFECSAHPSVMKGAIFVK
jgi:plastocyanin